MCKTNFSPPQGEAPAEPSADAGSAGASIWAYENSGVNVDQGSA